MSRLQRVGVGGAYQVSERLALDSEVYGGDTGMAACLGSGFLVSDRTSLYLHTPWIKSAPIEFIQKSHIFSVDASYDLTRRWTLGAKYAYRLGQLSLDR